MFNLALPVVGIPRLLLKRAAVPSPHDGREILLDFLSDVLVNELKASRFAVIGIHS